MLDLGYDYASCIRNSEKVYWTVDEVMPPDTRLDFSRPFLPPALSGSSRIDVLGDTERLALNQITGNAYANLFAFVEEYIIATAVDHAQAEMYGDHETIRALLRFAEEEIKHQTLFHRYLEAFNRDFGHECQVLDNAAEVAGIILSKSPIAVMLMTLHIELMTQAHYTESMRDNPGLDPLFASLLKHHWLEEAQHARIDALELDKLASAASRERIEQAFVDYLDLCRAVDGLLEAQTNMDIESLSRACNRGFGDDA
ncbi:MAG: diiron oxygenase, partial [Myxococcales bacterium]|nr:diiron oxygenase [Myxococcales bacterium]